MRLYIRIQPSRQRTRSKCFGDFIPISVLFLFRTQCVTKILPLIRTRNSQHIVCVLRSGENDTAEGSRARAPPNV